MMSYQKIDINIENVVAVKTRIEEMKKNGEKILRVIKPEDNLVPDDNTFALIPGTDFHNGTIKVKVLSRLLPEAPAYARGFIGVTFRTNKSKSEFECFYIRPANGNATDPVRRNRAVQYFTYPKYTYAYYREQGIKGYENSADINLNEWIQLKVAVHDEKAEFYVNDIYQPVLTINRLNNGQGKHGHIGLYVDIGTDGYFKDLEIEKED